MTKFSLCELLSFISIDITCKICFSLNQTNLSTLINLIHELHLRIASRLAEKALETIFRVKLIVVQRAEDLFNLCGVLKVTLHHC